MDHWECKICFQTFTTPNGKKKESDRMALHRETSHRGKTDIWEYKHRTLDVSIQQFEMLLPRD